MEKSLLILLLTPLLFSCGYEKDVKKENHNILIMAKKIPKENIYHQDTIIAVSYTHLRAHET